MVPTPVAMTYYPLYSRDTGTPQITVQRITEQRLPAGPALPLFPQELVLEVAYWCLDPTTLLNLSSTSRDFARIIRTPKVWLLHHSARGYDTGVLDKKAKRAAMTAQYGTEGWGILVKSAFDKAEFPDDSHRTQWNMKKPLPHLTTQREFDPNAIEKYQPRGERWMKVLYDIITEHEQFNLKLYPYLHDEALQIRVKSPPGRYFQALLCASELLIRMWTVSNAVPNTFQSFHCSLQSLDELPRHNERRSSSISLTKTFLIAKKIMELAPASQEERRLYPGPPLRPDIWEGPNGEIDPKGLGWTQKVRDDWKGCVYVVGHYTIAYREWHCPYNKQKLGPGVFRMRLDFTPDGDAEGRITGRGLDSGGRFQIEEGTYHKTFVQLVKRYPPEDGEEPDIYYAQGHMTPWGVFGSWTRQQEPDNVLGYWSMWIYEGAPEFGIKYEPRPGWFEEYERLH